MSDKQANKPSPSEAKRIDFKKVVNERIIYDPSNVLRTSYTVFDKQDLRDYMQNPPSYYKQLRNLSRYLYNRSQVYHRIINDNATLINPDYRTVIPKMDLVKDVDQTKILKIYNQTIDTLDAMNLKTEFIKIALRCWIEDVFYGVYYFFKDEGAVLLPIDPDYCQIVGVYPTGDFSFAMNMDYFNGKDALLELWGEPFESMKREADGKTGASAKWVKVPDEYCACFKINADDYSVPLPPLMSLFASIIDLEDLKEISSIADEQQIYKLLAFTVPLQKDSHIANDFAVDLDVASDYYNRVKEALPDFTDAIITPIPVESISFDKDAATDVNKVENAAKNIMKTSGHTVLADNEGAQATRSALIADSNYAMGSLLPQFEGWVNRILSYKLSNAAYVKFMKVTEQTKEAYVSMLIQDMNYGLPMSMTLGALAGFNEKQMISMAKMGQALQLDELFKPMQTAATQSSDSGRPKDDIQSTDGESSEEKRDKAK